MKIFITLLLLAMPQIKFTVAQEGTLPKVTCQILENKLTHNFLRDPNIRIDDLRPNTQTIEKLKAFITSVKDQKCSIVTDIQVFNTSFTTSSNGPYSYTESILLRISSNRNNTNVATIVTDLSICVTEVLDANEINDNVFKNSIKLNVSGELKKAQFVNDAEVDDNSCCHLIYGKPKSTNECCKPGFIKIGDTCACPKGKFLNETTCDVCPEDTYQNNAKSTSCLACENGTSTYGKTGADDPSLCLKACLPGQKYNKDAEKCEACQRNFYQPNEAQLFCIPCQNNRITKHGGSTREQDCVESCQKGSFYNFKSNSCELCPKNSFQAAEGQFNCTSCESGKITVSNGSKLQDDCIINCSQGSFFNRTTGKCQGCPLHTYQPRFGTIECIDCPNEGITVNTSSKLQEDCIANCSAGSFYNSNTRKCEDCPLSTYQPSAGQTGCIPCLDGRITVNISTTTEQDCIKDCDPGFIYNRTQSDCIRCPMGTYKPTKGQAECTKCPNGTITYLDKPNTNITDCGEECHPGYFFNVTSWTCTKCPRNTTQSNRGQKMCENCPLERPITEKEGTVSQNYCIGICQPGYYFNRTFFNCTKCEKKTYQPNSGTSQCLKCNRLHTTFERGSTSISQCVKGCQPGSHHVDKTEDCKLCSKGSFQSEWGQETCEICPNDTMVLQEGSTRKEDCFAVCRSGEYHNNDSGICDPCPQNEYQPFQRQFTCIKCPTGRLTLGERSTSLKDCLPECGKGKYYNSTLKKCEQCPVGTFKDSDGLNRCTNCESRHSTINSGAKDRADCILICAKGSYYNDTLRQCSLCLKNFYQNNRVSTSCLPCPEGRTTTSKGTESLEECKDASEGENLNLIVTIPVVLTVFVLSGCLLLICFYRRWQKDNERRMSQAALDPRRRASTDIEIGGRPKLDSSASASHHYKIEGHGLKPDTVRPTIRIANIPKELEIPRVNLRFLGQVLGKGNFGKVEKAILLREGTENVVAVKMIKGGGTFSDEKELFDELEMLATLYPHPHPNIVNLIGGCTNSDGPLFVVVEYCGEGNLLKYLQKNQLQSRPRQEYVNIFPKPAKPGLSLVWKLQKALEICRGMAHLAKFKIIHRDVAARNVLLDGNMVAKISDFGMARDIYVKQIYRKDTEGFLPVRWMAIESLESFIYTTESDVWSFGVLLWEISSDGRVPYNNILDHNQLLGYIKSGRVMKRPKNCPKDIYHIMEKCWARNPSDRPSFKSLEDALEALYEDELHKDDALPQRIFRKFSSRRKKRKPEEVDETPGRKLRGLRTRSNLAATKISEIEEEPKEKNEKKSAESGIKMDVLNSANVKETFNNQFENEGYHKSCSSVSEDCETAKPGQNTSHESNFELDTISEIPSTGQTEEGDSSHGDIDNKNDETAVHDSAVSALTLQEEIEKELHAKMEFNENRRGLTKTDEFLRKHNRARPLSTDC